jgi:tricorn protease interacting factor F2/3
MKIEKYDIELNIDFRKLEYTGVEKITLAGEGDTFFLNSVGIDIHEISSRGKPIKFTINSKDETVNTDHKLGPTETIEVKFSARVGETLMGLYVAKYGNDHMITTQFESTGARQAFPCVDHPNYKAVFSLKLVIDNDLEAISNMPVASTEKAGDKKRVIFNDTPRMSTYLLYIGVGKFDSISRKMGHIDGYLTAPRGRLMSNDFPLVEADHVIAKYEDYFGIKYVLPKLHLISVPEFGAGAMENWGAITFRELVILAHQWFGDLVTMEWWNDLWLNESFATFMSFKMVDELHKDWYMWGDFFMTETAGALNGDSLQNSHPIEAEVKTPDDIAQIFDEISYGKGASILRMIEGYAGKDNFRNGIRKYLKDHEYGNAKGSDLWESIEKASGMPVSRIMEAWIRRKGYPVILASRDGDAVKLRQEQFLLDGSSTNETWPVPLTIVRENGTESVLMEDREMKIPAAGFIKLNSDFTGFYRTVYDSGLFASVSESRKSISGHDLWGLANDLYAALQSGRIPYGDYMGGIMSIWDATDPLVLQEINSQMNSLYLLKPHSKSVREAAMKFASMHLERLGEKHPGEEINISIARAALSLTLSLVDDRFAAAMAEKFSRYFSLDPDIRQVVAISYARTTGDFDSLKETLARCVTDEDRTKIIGAMGWLGKPESLGSALDLIRNGQVKKQDTGRFYISAANCPDSREFLLTNFDFMVRQLKEVFVGSRVPSRTIEATVPLIGIGREAEMRRLLQGYTSPDLQTGVKKSLEGLNVNIRMAKAIP